MSIKSGAHRSHIVAIALGVGVALLLTSLRVSATNTSISTQVCGGVSNPAFVSIDQPLSDSVFSESVINLQGRVRNVSQLDISINNIYNSTFAIGSKQSVFNEKLTLSPGTKTITLSGKGNCGESISTSIVVTHQPVSGGGIGAVIPTEISVPELQVLNSEQLSTISDAKPESDSRSVGTQGKELIRLPTIDAQGSRPSIRIFDNLGLAQTYESGRTDGTLRVAAVTAGVSVLVFSTEIASFGIRRLGSLGLIEMSDVINSKAKVGLRVLSVSLILIAITL